MDTFTYIGIDINRKAPHVTFIAIDETAVPLAIDTGSIEDLLAYLAGLHLARVGINAPLSLNTGRLKHLTRKRNSPGKMPNMREIEYELEAIGAGIYHTPDQPQRNDPVLHFGLALAALLPQMGYIALTNKDSTSLSFLETPATAGYWSFVNAPILEEDTLMGRVQRQLILFDLDIAVKNPMDFFEEITRFRIKHGQIPFGLISSKEELNAWMAAYTALKSHQSPSDVYCLGTKEEGLIYLPTFPDDLQLPIYNSQESLF